MIRAAALNAFNEANKMARDPLFQQDIKENIAAVGRGARTLPVSLAGGAGDLAYMAVNPFMQLVGQGLRPEESFGTTEYLSNIPAVRQLIGQEEDSLPYQAGAVLPLLALANVPDTAEMVGKALPKLANEVNSFISDIPKDFAAITPEGSSFGDMLRVIEGKSFPEKLAEGTKVDAYNPDKAGTNVAVIPKKKGTSGLTLEGQEIRRLNNEIARTRKKVKDAEKANNQQLVTENTQLELQLTNQKKNYLAELGKQYEGKVYFWEGDKFLDMQSGQDIGESIVDGVNIGVDRSGMIVDKKAPAKVFMTVGEGITEPGSTRLTGFKKTNKENSVIATNLRVRSHFEWTDIKGERIKPPQGMEDQKIVSVAVGDKHYYTIDLKQQGPTYLLKEGVDAQKLQKGSVRGARGDATDNPHLKTVQVGDIYLNNSEKNIIGYVITKTAKNKVAHPVYKQIHTVGNQMPDVN